MDEWMQQLDCHALNLYALCECDGPTMPPSVEDQPVTKARIRVAQAQKCRNKDAQCRSDLSYRGTSLGHPDSIPPFGQMNSLPIQPCNSIQPT